MDTNNILHGYFLWLAQPEFLYNPGSAKVWYYSQWAGPLLIQKISEKMLH